jgi:hypothetical protein
MIDFNDWRAWIVVSFWVLLSGWLLALLLPWRRYFHLCVKLCNFINIVDCHSYGKLERRFHIGILWALVTFFMSSNVLFTVGFVIADRVLYIPCFAWCYLIALSVATLTKAGVCCVVVCVMAVVD